MWEGWLKTIDPNNRPQCYKQPFRHLTEEELRGTLAELGTPRLAFGFLGAVLAEHARDLADGLPADAPEWRVPRRRFDILRANWLDRARGLRRALN